MPKDPALERLEAETVEFCRELIRIDTTNYGGNKGQGELQAAQYVAELLREVGLDAKIYQSAPGRANVVARLAGSDPDLPALVVHGHLDVVPAIAEDWSVDPFAAELIDGMIWGRGAVDMKNMDAMIIAVIRHTVRERITPRRDLVIAFFADEEAGGDYGAGWMVTHHPE
ncbi:M20/M25/M40 family metallo-hydrolase, partial [Glutamicibacter sp. BSL13]